MSKANPFVHVELMSTNVEKAKTFYSRMFDWKLENIEMNDKEYTMIRTGDRPDDRTVGGIMQNPFPDIPSLWVTYVEVLNLQDAVTRAVSLGAKLVKEETVPDSGSFALISDPTGALLGLWQPHAKNRR